MTSLFALGCKSTMTDFIKAEDFTVSAPALRGAKIDEKASALDWRPEFFMDTDDERWAPKGYLNRARADLTEGFDHMLGAREDGKPARFRVTLEEMDPSSWMMAFPCFVFLTLFGCPTGYYSAAVNVELEVEGTLYEERVELFSMVFFYSDFTSLELPRASDKVAIAVVEALRRIDAKARNNTGGRPVPKPMSGAGTKASEARP